MSKAPKKVQATEGERALGEVSQAQWQDYVSRFRPAEAALIKDAELTGGERAQVKGEVAADTAAAFAGLDRSTIASAKQSGADISSGKTKLSLAGDATAAGAVKGLGQAGAETGAEIDSTGRQLGITATGRDIATDVTRNLSRGAQRATTAALQVANAKTMRNNARTNAFATVAGAAVRKFGPSFQGDLEEIDVAAINKKRKGGFDFEADGIDSIVDPSGSFDPGSFA